MPVDMKVIISQTLISMAKQRGIDKITVKALIDECHISRQTFYYHFQDLMEVIEWSMEQIGREVLERSLQAETPEETIKIFLSAALENRTLILKLMDSQKREQIEKLFVHAARTYLKEIVKSRRSELSMKYSDMEVALDFWAFGISACYTSANFDSITSEEFFDSLIDMGVYFIWYFHYMPVGNDASPELMPTPQQRTEIYRRIRKFRAEKPLFAMDFQNDAEYVGGCIAGGRRYLHINANGDVDPCVFVHYSDSNIREKTGAHSTDLQSPESAEHLCAKCDAYAAAWTPVAEKLWEENRAGKQKKQQAGT